MIWNFTHTVVLNNDSTLKQREGSASEMENLAINVECTLFIAQVQNH